MVWIINEIDGEIADAELGSDSSTWSAKSSCVPVVEPILVTDNFMDVVAELISKEHMQPPGKGC
jgi:hypothetical protein